MSIPDDPRTGNGIGADDRHPEANGLRSAAEDARNGGSLVEIAGRGPTGTALVRYDAKIGALLLAENKVSEQSVSRILQVQVKGGLKEKFGRIAIRMNLVSDRDVQIALARQFGYHDIEQIEQVVSPHLYMALAPFSTRAERLNHVLGQLLLSHGSEKLAMAVVSPDTGDGRSAFAANLALAYSMSGKRTLLVDADLRKPVQHELFGLKHSLGLTSLVRDDSDWNLDRDLPLVVPTPFKGLWMLRSGAGHVNPIKLLHSENFARLISTARRTYDVVVVDTPPSRTCADAEIISAITGSVLLVARENHSRLNAIQRLVTSLKGRKVRLLGSVLS